MVEKLATAKTPSTAGMTAKAESPATAGMKATAEIMTTPGTPTKAGSPATFSTSGTKETPAAAEMHTLISRRANNSNDASNNKSSRDAINNTETNI